MKWDMRCNTVLWNEKQKQKWNGNCDYTKVVIVMFIDFFVISSLFIAIACFRDIRTNCVVFLSFGSLIRASHIDCMLRNHYYIYAASILDQKQKNTKSLSLFTHIQIALLSLLLWAMMMIIVMSLCMCINEEEICDLCLWRVFWSIINFKNE